MTDEAALLFFMWDGGEGTVYEHMKKILGFSCRQAGRAVSAKGCGRTGMTV